MAWSDTLNLQTAGLTVYAIASTATNFSTGTIAGSDSAVPKRYVFTGLTDGVNYEVRQRAGLSPADTDTVLGILTAPVEVTGGGGGTTDTDAIVDGVLAGIGARTPRFVSSFDPDTNSLTLFQRDDYADSNSRGLRFDLTTAFPEGDTILFGAKKRNETDITGSGLVEVNEDDEHFVVIELSTEDLDRLAGQWSYSLTHVNADEKRHTFVNAELFLEAVSTAGGGIPPD